MDSPLKYRDNADDDEVGRPGDDLDLEAQILTLVEPNWNAWEPFCKQNGCEVPNESDWVFWPVARTRFPRMDSRGFSALFGCCAQVFEVMYRRYYYKLLFFGVEPEHILWTYTFLSTNDSYDAIAAIWDVSRSTLYKKIRYTLAVLFQVLDEVRG